MLASTRQAEILRLVEEDGSVRVADLVERFGVSDMTIRRDIAELATRGFVQRVHGGAVAWERPHATSMERDWELKVGIAAREKAAIAKRAADFIRPESAIALSAGTTTRRLAQVIAERPDLRPLTIVTNSLSVAQVLYDARDANLAVVLTGGNRTASNALVGPLTVSALHQLRVDQLYLGAHGVDELGMSTPNLFEAETNRALVSTAAEIIVLADHSKWGAVGLAVTVQLDRIDVFISDTGLTRTAQRAISTGVGRLVLVDPEEPEGTA